MDRVRTRSLLLCCSLCGSTKIAPVVQTKKLQIVGCCVCDLRFVPQRKRERKAAGEYYQGLDTRAYVTYYRPFRKLIHNRNWELICKIKSGGRGLDFGASFGWFLEVAPKTWEMEGMEPSKEVVERGKRQGLNIREGNELILRSLRKKFDLITLWNVFEHLDDPWRALATFRARLRKGGILAISVPNRDGLINRFAYVLYTLTFARIVGPLNTLFQVKNPTPHLFHYNLKNLTYMLNATGFEIVEWEAQPIIDVSRLSERFNLENPKTGTISILIGSIILRVLSALSSLLKMPDEISIYAKRVR